MREFALDCAGALGQTVFYHKMREATEGRGAFWVQSVFSVLRSSIALFIFIFNIGQYLTYASVMTTTA